MDTSGLVQKKREAPSDFTYFHGQETRDVSASFPFLNWRPPLRLIDQLAIYISWYFCVDLEANMILYRSSVADILGLIPCIRISS